MSECPSRAAERYLAAEEAKALLASERSEKRGDAEAEGFVIQMFTCAKHLEKYDGASYCVACFLEEQATTDSEGFGDGIIAGREGWIPCE